MLARDGWHVAPRATPLDNVIDVDHGTAAPQDRRSVRGEACCTQGPAAWDSFSSGTRYIVRAALERCAARLTLWHAGVWLMRSYCTFAAGILLLSRRVFSSKGSTVTCAPALMTVDWAVITRQPES